MSDDKMDEENSPQPTHDNAQTMHANCIHASADAKDAVPVHRCRFVQHTPSAIVSLAFAPAGPQTDAQTTGKTGRRLLAVARANGNIELWNPRGQTWFLERTVPGTPDAPIEAVGWAWPQPPADDRMETDDSQNAVDSSEDAHGPRLFCAGLAGRIVEIDVLTGMPLHETDSYGGPIWCMSVSHAQTQLAVGCEDGFVRIFRIPPQRTEPLEFVATVEKQPARIMSLAWHPSDKFIVAGSAKSSFASVAVATGKCEHRMTLDKVRGEDTIAWDLKVVLAPTALAADAKKTAVIVVADSLGYVTFWDWATGTLRKRIKAHGADALCLATNAAGTRVLSSGVDRKVVEIALTDLSAAQEKNKQPGRRAPQSRMAWVVGNQKRFHSHDVRALLHIEERPFNTLVSGGVDGTLIFSEPASEFYRLKQMRMPTFPHRSIITIAPSARLLLARFDDHAHIYRLGAVSQMDMVAPALLQDHQRLEHDQHRLLINLKFKGLTNLCASAISDDGCWVALSDAYQIRLYHITIRIDQDKPPVVRRIRRLPASIPGAFGMAFTPDSRRLAIAGTDARVYVVGLEEDAADDTMPILAVFENHAKEETAVSGAILSLNQPINASGAPSFTAAAICSIVVSSDGQWLATGDILNHINVFNLNTLKLHSTLPVFRFLHTNLSFHPSQPILIVPCTSNEFFLYNVELGRLTDWSRSYSQRLPKHFLMRRDTVMGVTVCRDQPNMVVVWGPTYFTVVDLDKPIGVRDDNVAPKRVLNGNVGENVELINGVTDDAQSKRTKRGSEDVVNDNHDDNDVAMDSSDKTFMSAIADAHRSDSTLGKPSRRPRHFRNAPNVSWSSDLQPGTNSLMLDHRFQAVMHIEYVGSELVVVERPVLHVLAALPQAFYKHKYGT